MINCDQLIHPFQHEPGTSQRQRIMDDLLSGAAKIDGRSLADLLDYFVQLSRHINYYDSELNVSDWQPFFRKSIPFSLATIIKFNREAVNSKVEGFTTLFEKKPSRAGLQLLVHYFFYQVISRVNDWHLQLKDSGLPAELIIEKLIKDKLKGPVEKFICLHNAGVKWYCVNTLKFDKLAANPVWSIDLTTISADGDQCRPKGKTRRKRMLAYYLQVRDLLPVFLDSVRIISDTAEQSIEQSLFPLNEELQKKHSPHLALLFSFLKLFRHLQDNLNEYTKKHLDYFYKQVLRLKSRDAVGDRVHIVFEIQKQLDNYLLKKGLKVKDGKDNNKAEILFATDDEIVVNKAQVADKRTLFLNNRDILEKTYLEGVYMASNADKADGVKKDFTDAEPKSFATLGAKLSRYKAPEKTLVQPYPNARLGFILASPVLLLNEGTRTIDITLACGLSEDYCNEMNIPETRPAVDCCEERTTGNTPGTQPKPKFPDFINSISFYDKIVTALNETYYYINEDLVVDAAKKGISKDLEKKLRGFLEEIQTRNNSDSVCYCPVEIFLYEKVIKASGAGGWLAFLGGLPDTEQKILVDIFKPRKALQVLFSGDKEWIAPLKPYTISITPVAPGNEFRLKIHITISPEQPAISYYNKDNLKEDFNSTLPLVKVELDDKIKLTYTNAQLLQHLEVRNDDQCCLLKTFQEEHHAVSLYHFFRNVIVIDGPLTDSTRIDVSVCGLKNFIVQNEESVQDVNGPVYPFGVRPVVDSNFYLGSEEVFSKNWQNIQVNHNWKDKPTVTFEEYYTAYQHMFIDPNDINNKTIEGIIKDNNFKASFALLNDGNWFNDGAITCDETGVNSDNLLFRPISAVGNLCQEVEKTFAFAFKIDRSDILNLPGYAGGINLSGLKRLNADSRNGFLRITLKCQDFQHDRYAFILSRQMMAFGRLPDDLVAGAYYRVNPANAIIVFNSIGALAGDLNLDITNLEAAAANTKTQTSQTINEAHGAGGTGAGSPVDIEAHQADNAAQSTVNRAGDVRDSFDELALNIPFLPFLTPSNRTKLEAVIPNEPWTPIIKNISLDYTATATMTDIDLIHLYPYEGTYKKEEITLTPMLFPSFCDEGTLFIGLKELVPGNNLNILFQLAEATSDSESDREETAWYYLDSNTWKTLRKGFEVLEDDTDGLTTSGIIKFALPANMTKDNTILPKELHWIKASVPKNSRTVSETIAVYTQAVRATFTNEAANDKTRLQNPLPAGAIAKLNEADANVKKLIQPYESFGGRLPEAEGHYYVRVSELLRHKGRAIQKFDYERLALEAFPELYKVKCINHSFALNAYKYKNDFPVAPGYVILAVIPDLNKLKAVQSFEPRVPVSMLEDIQEEMKKLTSPFVRFRAMNPRYEKVQFCIKVKLVKGRDENYYREKLKQDLSEFMAPWSVGKYDKFSFGQCVNRSDMIRFIESLDYINYIKELIMWHIDDPKPAKDDENKLRKAICPKTPRSILIAGNIDVCIPAQECEAWEQCDDVERKNCCENEKIPIAEYCKPGIG